MRKKALREEVQNYRVGGRSENTVVLVLGVQFLEGLLMGGARVEENQLMKKRGKNKAHEGNCIRYQPTVVRLDTRNETVPRTAVTTKQVSPFHHQEVRGRSVGTQHPSTKNELKVSTVQTRAEEEILGLSTCTSNAADTDELGIGTSSLLTAGRGYVQR